MTPAEHYDLLVGQRQEAQRLDNLRTAAGHYEAALIYRDLGEWEHAKVSAALASACAAVKHFDRAGR